MIALLTPRHPIDLLAGVESAKLQGRPYTIVFVGVNGVGKSTSLAKVVYFLKRKGYKVLHFLSVECVWCPCFLSCIVAGFCFIRRC